MPNHIVFDVGAHKGEDTAFYLAKGFKVVAIEANPSFCRHITQRFQDAVLSGALVVLNLAISRTIGKIGFYIDEDNSVWGTANADWVERNKQLGAGNVKRIVVDSAPLSDVIKRFGVPYYCKIDIEGNDVDALASLADCGDTPSFVSIESEKRDWNRLLEELKLLHSLGYRRFKMIDQSYIDLQECPDPAAEGQLVKYKFESGSSGLFGEELPGSWLSLLEIIEAYKNVFRGYALNGDGGFFPGGAFGAIARVQSKIIRMRGARGHVSPVYTLPPAGWYDTHAGK